MTDTCVKCGKYSNATVCVACCNSRKAKKRKVKKQTKSKKEKTMKARAFALITLGLTLMGVSAHADYNDDLAAQIERTRIQMQQQRNDAYDASRIQLYQGGGYSPSTGQNCRYVRAYDGTTRVVCN